MKFIKLQVQTILEHYPDTADNNSLLVQELYSINYGIGNREKISDLFDKILNKEIPSIETICRLSRHLQEKIPKLRGEKWAERQSKQDKVKKDLGYNLKNK